ncbi:unnamed protein product [Euphydryas editha]|uniref:Reverse transcriptase n=1 Tax=Euphydryas editha TaxID=104508 RepID=A0AAU9TYN6_EUPED|nr:unnamed protein product [Euphydryas editha]
MEEISSLPLLEECEDTPISRFSSEVTNQYLERNYILNKNNSNDKEDKTNYNFINFNEHVKEEEVTIDLSHLNNQLKSEINKLIVNINQALQRINRYDIGTVKCYEARIDLTVQKYDNKRPYKCLIKDKLEIEEQVEKLLKKNLLEKSYSPFAAPVTLALKKDNLKTRLYIDFRDLNKIVRRKKGKSYTAKNLINNINDLCKKNQVCLKNKTRGQIKYGFVSHFGSCLKTI